MHSETIFKRMRFFFNCFVPISAEPGCVISGNIRISRKAFPTRIKNCRFDDLIFKIIDSGIKRITRFGRIIKITEIQIPAMGRIEIDIGISLYGIQRIRVIDYRQNLAGTRKINFIPVSKPLIAAFGKVVTQIRIRKWQHVIFLQLRGLPQIQRLIFKTDD